MKIIPLLCFRTLPLACRPLKWTWKVIRRSSSALSPGCRAHLEVIFLLQSVIDLFSDFDELSFLFFLSCTTPEANTDRNTPLSPRVLHFGVFPLVFKNTAHFVFHINQVISIFPFYCLTLWKPASFFPSNVGGNVRGDDDRGVKLQLSFRLAWLHPWLGKPVGFTSSTHIIRA